MATDAMLTVVENMEGAGLGYVDVKNVRFTQEGAVEEEEDDDDE